MLRTGGDAPIR